MYHVAEPNAYLIITGAGIKDLLIKKKAWIWPFQKCTKISVTPFDFSIQLQAMTMEKLKFSLPAVFTIGPRDESDALARYATLLTGKSDGSPVETTKGVVPVAGNNHVQDIVKGIIEGEIRSIVATMSMEELFRERQVFKTKVIQSVQSELEQFGLCIYNANVKELQDTPGSEYFSYLSRKAHEGALNQAKIDVADARAKGEIGEADQQGKAKQEIAKINAATAVLETKRKAEKAAADAELTGKEISIEKELSLERISAKRAAETRDAELQKSLEIKRAEMELERQRATTVTTAKIQRESAEQKAQADLFTSNAKADAVKYQAQAVVETKFLEQKRGIEADVLRQTEGADAALHARQKEAQAMYLERKAEADGIKELASAYNELSHVFGGPQGLMQYLMLKDDTYEKLALANAQAVNNLQPKINIWTTGEGGTSSDSMAPIRNLFQCLPPLMGTINDQTGMTPLPWMMQMPARENEVRRVTKAEVNGIRSAGINGSM